jgi:hypothetical protein
MKFGCLGGWGLSGCGSMAAMCLWLAVWVLVLDVFGGWRFGDLGWFGWG